MFSAGFAKKSDHLQYFAPICNRIFGPGIMLQKQDAREKIQLHFAKDLNSPGISSSLFPALDLNYL